MNPRTVTNRATIAAGAGIVGMLSLAGCAADAPSSGADDAAQGGSDTSAVYVPSS